MAVDATHQTVSALEVSKIFPLKKKRGGRGRENHQSSSLGLTSPSAPSPVRQMEQVTD